MIFLFFLRPISPKTKNPNKSYDFFPLWAHCAAEAVIFRELKSSMSKSEVKSQQTFSFFGGA